MSHASKLGLGLIAGAAALAMVPQAAEAGTVVASSGPSAETYPVGTQIGDTQRISLRAGDSLTVLDGGRTRVLEGPGSFILAQRGASTSGNTTLANLTRRQRGQARVASSRGPEGSASATNPNIWYVDVAASGTVCLASTERLNLWRADSSAEAMYTIAPASAPDDGVTVTFPADEMLARWDSALQLRDGHAYTIAGGGSETPTQVTFSLLDEMPTDVEEMAQAFIARGCTIQLGQLVSAAQSES
ncbi:hypothetical protein [Aurantiacibacter gilvus]|uniref:FecR protein domain-containing protein n=1 Tax=Aurantiacibacter gilvus TaxID=3139141 RepID=A0ABU9I9M4_9SPHN